MATVRVVAVAVRRRSLLLGFLNSGELSYLKVRHGVRLGESLFRSSKQPRTIDEYFQEQFDNRQFGEPQAC